MEHLIQQQEWRPREDSFEIPMADGWGGFHRNLLANSSLMAELWAFRDGHNFAREEHVLNLETDGCFGCYPTAAKSRNG